MRMPARAATATGTAVLCLSLSGCLSAPFQPPTGIAYSNYQAPLSVDHNKTAVAAKQGEAHSVCILGLVSFGDSSLQTAATNGGLSTIEHADYSYFNVLGIYQKTGVVVHGQ